MKAILYFFCLFFLGCVTESIQTQPNNFTDFKSCTVIDSDFGIDDIRAISMIMPRFDYNILVATEGLTRTSYGVKIAETYLQNVISKYNGDVFEGKASKQPLVSEWLKEKREAYETMNGYLPSRIPASRPRTIADVEFKTQVEACQSITLFILGPATSFHAYKNHLKNKKVTTLAYGTFPSPKNKNLGFNCEYDKNSCFGLAPHIESFNMSFVKLSPKFSYYLTSNEVAKMKDIVKSIHESKTDTWDNPQAQMWDDAVAMYLYHPDKFQKKGRQLYPKLKPDDYRKVWASLNSGN